MSSTRHSARWRRAAVLLAMVIGLPKPAVGWQDAVSGATRARPPNVLFVFVDQLRADVLGAYGGKSIETPHMDRLAREGAMFRNALSTYPLCTPYRGMLMTGRYPTHTGLVMNFLEVNPQQRCIAHPFLDAAYRTGFIGKWHLSAGSHRKVGLFEGKWADAEPYMKENPHYNFVPPGSSRLGFDHWAAYNFHAKFLRAPYYRDEPVELFMENYETDAEVDLAIEFMHDCRRNGRRFFLMVAPHPPHPPFKRTPVGYLEQIPEDLPWDQNVPQKQRTLPNQAKLRGYLAMCKNVDDNVGRLLAWLDEKNMANDTIVILTSDHGEMMGSHGRTNKMVPYREAVRVPMLMRWPGKIQPGLQIDTLHTPLDHFPTLCGVTGMEAPDNLDGLNLGPALLGEKVEREAVLMMSMSSHWDFFRTGTDWPEWRGVKTERFTYARWLKGEEELYDDVADPFQESNLVSSEAHSEDLSRMRAHLTRLLAEAHDDFLPGTAYAEWYDDERNLLKTALGPVQK